MLLRPVVVTALGLFALPLQAASLTPFEILNQFNLVVTGNATSTSDVDGRTFVGGNLTGGSFAQKSPSSLPPSNYAGLTVLGNANDVNKTRSINVNNLGITVKGNLTDSNINQGPGVVGGDAKRVNFNGNTGGSHVFGNKTQVNQNSGQLGAAAATAILTNAESTDFASVLATASDALAQLTGNSFVTISGNRVTFKATPINGVAIFDITAIDTQIFSKGEFAFEGFESAAGVIINADDANISINANFLANSALSIASKTLWNFHGTTTLNLRNQFGGSFLATGAAVTTSNNVEGTGVMRSLTQNGEFHSQPFNGWLPPPSVPTGNPVPEPSVLSLLLAGLALGGLQRARHAGPSSEEVQPC